MKIGKKKIMSAEKNTGCILEEENDVDSADEALCEMLGLSSLDAMEKCNDDDKEDLTLYEMKTSLHGIPHLLSNIHDEKYDRIVTLQRQNVQETFENDSVCNLSGFYFSIPSSIMRKLTEDLIWGHSSQIYKCDVTMETIQQSKRVVTRFENFVNSHDGWKELTCRYIPSLLQLLLGNGQWVLYKEKLNLKPPGGSGFAPHVDTPSLRVPFPDFGPKNFLTVMIAIDDMHIPNGCMQFVKQKLPVLSSKHTPDIIDCLVSAPTKNNNGDDDNPDAGGRQGAIDLEIANQMPFEYWPAKAGDIIVFDGWIPHRSGPNKHYFSRRAVYLTYNPLTEGDWHDAYYDKMRQLRQDYKYKQQQKQIMKAAPKSTLNKNETLQTINDEDIIALQTIPKI